MERTRVLIVEDEPNIVESLRFILERADFAVEALASGTDALDRLRRGRFSAAILDVMLPGMNGFELLRAIRADPALKRLPVLVLTAKGQAADRRMAETIGADAFITKPFSNADVVARVRSIVGA
ncbi:MULTISPECIES: response regulator transcription factor [Nitratireductor]|uniref:response regulator transcription factor n=1 Tax=Nitratireductor TaxID=245876 RepID=UPI000D0DC429|nr:MULTISPECIES: response regulator [Nitratireductor]PSM20283.1 two-component system response regulator [Nitratireductor sp. StC3]